MAVNQNYKVSEGNMIGHQEPQALGTTQNKLIAKGAITKGMLVESTGTDWEVQAASDNSITVIGIAAFTVADTEAVTIDTEGFVKLSASNAIVAAGDYVMSAGAGLVKKMPALAVGAADMGAAYVQAASNAAVNAGFTEVEVLLAALAGRVGIVVAGCAANGFPYVKLR